MAADDTITGILRTAHESVVAAAISEPLQAVALEKAIDLLAAREGLAPGPPTPTTPGARVPVPPVPGDTQDKSLDRIAAALGLGADTVGEVYHLDGDALSLSIGTAKLADANKGAAKEIALLIAGGRQLGGWDAEWTETSSIRPVAETYGKLDGNFATALTEMDDDFSFSGSGKSRKVKLKRKRRENLTALVKRLAGEE